MGINYNRTRTGSLGAAGKKVLRDRYLYILLLPGIIYFILFCYLPMGGLVIAFKKFNIFTGVINSPWVGFDNFKKVFSYPDFWGILRNTLFISFYKIIFGFPVPIILSILLNEIKNSRFKKIAQSVMYLPHFISWVIIGSMMLSLFSASHGVVNLLFGEHIIGSLLASRRYFRSILVISSIWKTSGWGTIIYLAALSQIDPSLYEAAIVDGANKLKQVWYITIPSITGIIVLLLILRIGQLMNAGFEQVMVLQNPLVMEVSEIFDTYVYRVGLGRGEYSFTSAVDFFKSVVALILIVSADRFSKMIGEEGLF